MLTTLRLATLLLFSGTALAGDLTGTWILNIDTPRGLQHPTLVVNQTEDGYSGIYHSLRGPIEIDAIEHNGDNFSFPLTISVPIGDIEVNYQGSISGDEMTGVVENPRGEVPFTGSRKP